MQVPEMEHFRGEMELLVVGRTVGCRTDARSKNLVGLLLPCSGRGQWATATIPPTVTRCDSGDDGDGYVDDRSGLGWFRDDAVGGNRPVM